MLRSSVFWTALAGVAVAMVVTLPLGAQDEAKPAVKPDEAQAQEILRFLPEDEPDNESLVYEALDRYVSLQFDDLPLKAVAAAIAKKCHISVVFDELALADEKVQVDTPISLDVSRVTLRSALKLALDPLRLRAVVEDGVLMITTRAMVMYHTKVVVYDVTDLEQARLRERGTSNLPQIIQDNTGGEPDAPWQDVDGEGGTLSLLKLEDADLLVVRTTGAVHAEIEELFADMRALREEAAEEEPVIATSAAAIERRLRQRVNINFDDVSWQTAVKTLATGIGVPVQIDPVIGEDPHVTYRAENTQASTVLERVLKPRHLAWQVSDNGLRVARVERLDQELEVQVYDVRWLLRIPAETKEPDFKGLIELVQTLEGGPKTEGTEPQMAIAGADMPGMPVLVVKAPRSRQVRIAKLLDEMRGAYQRFNPHFNPYMGMGMGGAGTGPRQP